MPRWSTNKPHFHANLVTPHNYAHTIQWRQVEYLSRSLEGKAGSTLAEENAKDGVGDSWAIVVKHEAEIRYLDQALAQCVAIIMKLEATSSSTTERDSKRRLLKTLTELLGGLLGESPDRGI